MREKGKISEKFILKTIQFWRKKTGREMDRDDAVETIHRLTELFRLLDRIEKNPRERLSTSAQKGANIDR